MVKRLLKLRLLSAFGQMANTGARKNASTKTRSSLMILLYLFVAAMFGAMITFICLALSPLILIGSDWFYFLTVIGIDFLIVFIFGVFATKAEIFECKDNELLLSMPIKPISIVLSRVFSVIIWNYIESFIIFLPAVIVYAVKGGAIEGIFGTLAVFVFLPLLPTAISCLVGFAVSFIASHFKSKTLVSVVFFLLFFGAYMFGYSKLVEGMDSMLLNVEGAAKSVGRFTFLRAIGDAAMLKPLPLLLLCAASVLSALLAILVITLGFEKITSANRGQKKRVYKEKRSKTRSPIFTMVKKELSRFFSSATYIINSALGVIFTVAVSVYAFIKIDELRPLADMLGMQFGFDPLELTSLVLVSMLSLCASLSFISACSLSLEGKSLWILKSMPTRAKDVLFAKAITHLVITALPTLIASVIAVFAVGEYSLIWYFILLPQAVNVISALLGVLFNTAFPKLEFTNEAAVIKNSASSILTMFISMLLSIALAIGGLWLLLRVNMILVAVLQLAALGLVIALLAVILVKVAAPKYETF